MVKGAVVWTETAAKQRREILRYWTLRNGSTVYAEKLIWLISRQIKVIISHPESFKLSEYSNTRESAIGYFSIFYKILEDRLIVTAFWDNRQDPGSLLLLLKEK